MSYIYILLWNRFYYSINVIYIFYCQINFMEEDILNYSPTVMFRGTPCIYYCVSKLLRIFPWFQIIFLSLLVLVCFAFYLCVRNKSIIVIIYVIITLACENFKQWNINPIFYAIVLLELSLLQNLNQCRIISIYKHEFL